MPPHLALGIVLNERQTDIGAGSLKLGTKYTRKVFLKSFQEELSSFLQSLGAS